MTFEQWWKEYCVKHHFDIGSPFEYSLREVAKDTYDKWLPVGIKIGYLYEDDSRDMSEQ